MASTKFICWKAKIDTSYYFLVEELKSQYLSTRFHLNKYKCVVTINTLEYF